MQATEKPASRGTAGNVRLVVCDVDGVLTEGNVSLDARGDESKSFSVTDGIGIRLLVSQGIQVGFLSGRKSAAAARRAGELGVNFCRDGVGDKRQELAGILDSLGVRPGEMCYIGDDLIDLSCLLLSGFPVAVANAHPEVKRCAAYITRSVGGRGAVREVAEVILRAQNQWCTVLQRYSR